MAEPSEYDYDLLVIGSGPGGQKAAIAAAKLGRRAAVVERGDMVGGVCINTGTIPSKTLREAVLYLTGTYQRDMYGQNYRVKQDITLEDLLARTTHVIDREIEVIRSQLNRNGVDLLHGTARFTDPHTVLIEGGPGGSRSASMAISMVRSSSQPFTASMASWRRPCSASSFSISASLIGSANFALTSLKRSSGIAWALRSQCFGRSAGL